MNITLPALAQTNETTTGNTPSRNQLLVAELLPAPVGYSYSFSPPYPSHIIGYRTPGEKFVPYRANIKDTGTYIVVDSIPQVKTIVHSRGSSPLDVIKIEDLYTVYGIIINGSRHSYIIYGAGMVFISPYDIYYDYPPPDAGNISHPIAVISGNTIDMTVKGLKVLTVENPYEITIITKNGSISTSLFDLLGAPESCLAMFYNKPDNYPWKGGLILSPSCTKNVKILKTVTYQDRPYAVVFTVNSKYGSFMAIMGDPVAENLEYAGLIYHVEYNDKYHIIPDTPIEGKFVYLVPTKSSRLIKGQVVQASNITQIVENNKHICSIPNKAKILYRLTWNNRELSGTIDLLPGEIVLLKYNNEYYVCTGDMSWIHNPDIPIIQAPKYRELKHDIILYTVSGGRFLVLLSDGEVYSGGSVKIPFEKYEDNRVYYLAGYVLSEVSITLSSIFTSAFFAISVIIIGVIASMIVFGRGTETKETIKIILDIPYPKAQILATEEEVSRVARKHLDSFAVCPSDVDLAIYHGILPPIPPDVKADEEIIYCPFNTNKKTESILRKINHLLFHSFWALKRIGKNYGYFYTIIGEEMPYMYIYKQENEKNPAQIIINGMVRAMRVRLQVPYFPRPLGLVLVVEPEMKAKVVKALKELESISGQSEGGKGYSYNISGYLPLKNIQVRVSVDKLQKFVNDKIRNIIVISEDNITDLIEYLSKISVGISELYYKKMRGEQT